MKRIVFTSVFCVLFLSGYCQTILNGDFENTTTTVNQINLSNAAFNSMMPNCFGFGSVGDIDIITTAMYCGLAENGKWYIAFTGSGTDALAMQLSQPLIAGNTYTLSFYDRGCSNWVPYPFDIGVSTTNNNFGTKVLASTQTPVLGTWTKRTLTFIAPNNGLYITVQMNGGGTGDWAHVDNFCLGNCGIGPVASFQSSDTAFCSEGGSCIDFTDHSSGNPTSWKWLFPGATPDTSTVQNPIGICYYTPGTYAVKLIVSNANGTDSLNVSPLIIFGSGAIIPVLTVKGDTIFCNHESGYQWYYNGTPIAGATDSFYVATGDGSYNVYITDGIGCSRLGNAVLFTLSNEMPGREGIKIYPNPVEDRFFIEGVEFGVSGSIEIYDMLGNKVYSSAISNKQEVVNSLKEDPLVVDCKSFAAGVYIVKITSGLRTCRIKFVKG